MDEDNRSWILSHSDYIEDGKKEDIRMKTDKIYM